jgi:WD40 repeat protein
MAAVAAALVGSLHGCKEKDSLIVLAVRASDTSVTGLRTLVVSCGSTTQTFHLTTPISTSVTTVGLYVPSSLTGSQSVVAFATGTQCGPGYEGSTTVQIAAAGDTTNGAIMMTPTTTCPPNSGSGGTKGTGGTTGTGGTGVGGVGGPPPACASSAQPPQGTPPALTCCAEYDLDTPEVCSASAYAGTEVDSVAFSPDGATVVTAARLQPNSSSSATGEVVVWSFDGHKLTKQKTLSSDGWFDVSFSPDGTKLAVAVQMGVDIWNTSGWTMNNALVGSSNLFHGAQFTPDGKQIIAVDQSSTAGTLYVFDLTVATPTVPIVVQALSGQPDSLAVAPKVVNGRLGIAVTYYAGTMDIFSYANGTLGSPTNVTVDATGFAVWTPAFSPDGATVAVGDTVSLIHTWAFPPTTPVAESGAAITFSTADSSDQVFAVDYAPNGSTFAAGGADSFDFATDAQIALFSVSSRAKTASAPLSFSPSSVAFSPQGNAIAGGEIDCGRLFLCTN